MRFAIIENGVVVNVAIADDALGDNWVASDVAGIGDTYENGQFTKPPAPPEPVPQEVSPRQIRQVLNRIPFGNGTLREAVEAAVASGDQDLKDWWEFSTTFERHNPQVTAMGGALGQTDSQLDDLWRLAATL